MTLATGVNFIKLFWCDLRPKRHNLSQYLRQYVDSSVNYAKKVFMKLATGVNFIKKIQCELQPEQHNLSQALRQFTDSRINNTKKFYEIGH